MQMLPLLSKPITISFSFFFLFGIDGRAALICTGSDTSVVHLHPNLQEELVSLGSHLLSLDFNCRNFKSLSSISGTLATPSRNMFHLGGAKPMVLRPWIGPAASGWDVHRTCLKCTWDVHRTCLKCTAPACPDCSNFGCLTTDSC